MANKKLSHEESTSNGKIEAIPELYRRYRPTKLKDVLGQDEAVGMLKQMLADHKVPHVMMLVGPSGVGKTTLGRILKAKLGCSNHDFQEVNCAAVESAIDTVRTIQQQMGLSPMSGSCRIWLLDECQSLSRAGFSQQALLKMLEDTPSHVYFILCTTDPSKLIKTIHTRCTKIQLYPVKADVIKSLVVDVSNKENKPISTEVVEALAEFAYGSPRQALVLLHQILGLATDKEQLEAIRKSDSTKMAESLVDALLDPNTKWEKVAAILRDIDGDEETLRIHTMACAAGMLLSNKVRPERRARAAILIEAFEKPFYSTPRPSLVRACFETFQYKD
ncbi:MAG: AAA family ATPase [Patescibacteria group bacterium]|nr:AAA family ATPase [Patescibacteria group bacterium]